MYKPIDLLKYEVYVQTIDLLKYEEVYVQTDRPLKI